jgi:hypothetical protein
MTEGFGFSSSELSSFAAFALNRGLFSCICNMDYPDELRFMIEQEKMEDGLRILYVKGP